MAFEVNHSHTCYDKLDKRTHWWNYDEKIQLHVNYSCKQINCGDGWKEIELFGKSNVAQFAFYPDI